MHFATATFPFTKPAVHLAAKQNQKLPDNPNQIAVIILPVKPSKITGRLPILSEA